MSPVAAIDAAGLADTLDGDGTFTVFAPPNAAFDKLPSGLVPKLLDPTWSPQLNDLLLYHVLGSEVFSTDLAEGLMAPTLNFQADEITVSLDPPSIDESRIYLSFSDMEASNGVVHAIGSVLTPPSISNSIVDVAVGNDDFSTLVAALSAAGLVDTLSGEGPFTVFGESISSVSYCFVAAFELTFAIQTQPRRTLRSRHCQRELLTAFFSRRTSIP